MKLILKRSRIVLAALLVAAVHSVSNAATPATPLLTNAPGWDCLISGQSSEQGIVFLTFSGDGYSTNSTFIGTMVNARVKKPVVGTDRSNAPRTPPVTPVPGPTITNLFGLWNADGRWAFDYKGYVVGSFVNLVLVGGAGSTNTITNHVSFRAKISPNKRLTATYSSTVGGYGTWRGVPMKTVTNVMGFAGGWTGEEKSSVTAYEWFSLSPTAPWPNMYDIDGYGAGYGLIGNCLVSSQKKIAFGNFKVVNAVSNVYFEARGSVGPLVNKKTLLGGKTKGLLETQTNVLTYTSFRVP